MSSFLNRKTQETILKNLEKENSFFENDKSRFNYGINVLNLLKKEILMAKNKDCLVDFVIQILECMNCEKNDLLDRYVLNILNIFFSEKLVKLLNMSDINSEAALLLVKYKNNMFDTEDVLEFIEINKNAIKTKQIRKDLIKELKHIFLKSKEEYDKENIIETSFKNYFEEKIKINLISDKKYFVKKVLMLKNNTWNDFSVYSEENLLSLIVHECKDKVTGNKLLNLFFNGLDFITRNEISNAIFCFHEIGKTRFLSEFMMDGLSFAYICKLKFKESEYIIEKCLEIHNLWYFKNLLAFIQRIAGFINTFSFISLDFNNLPLCLKKQFVLNKNIPEDIINKNTTIEFVQKHLYKKIHLLHFYIYDNSIYVFNYFNLQIVRISEDARIFLKDFTDIFDANRKICKNINTSEKWLNERNALDKRLRIFLSSMSFKFNLGTTVYILLEGILHKIPFEICIYDQNEQTRQIFRVFKAEDVLENPIKFDPNSCFYLLDPQKNLERTAGKISKWVKKSCIPIEKGVTGKALDFEGIKKLNKNKTFLYFGHGTGRKHYKIDKKSSLKEINLFGCSSAKVQSYHSYFYCPKNHADFINNNIKYIDVNLATRYLKFKNNGHLINIVPGKTVVGCLWDVTDRDLDAFTISFLEKRIRNDPRAYNFEYLREFCKTKHLNGGALVIFLSK
ncbi:hypothetical protein EHP00_378 [Ecytonucleospora hepatopenaei]|uniref:separase n=1 Tax=Ecytonucleospora hepatopenaei TaxID=646526 RepID=A0A1W0E9D6_9MICR|nr:hypothetical protein EHP00_378 [Ecytonucleospora hepatopenaei]